MLLTADASYDNFLCLRTPTNPTQERS